MGNFSNNLGKRVLNRGADKGHCVICGVYGKLSRDHVPPKKCNNLNDVELKTLLPSENSARVGTTSQGGAHYKTLCKECNSKRLGTNYDPSLINLSNEITSLVMGAKNRLVSLPETIHPFIKPQKIARAIVGHCLAAIAIEETKSGPIPSPIGDGLREYFLDESQALPDELDIYYWVYPSKRQVVIKAMGKSSMYSRATIVGHVIKFLPLGFWLVWNKPKGLIMNLNNLVPEKNMELNAVRQIELNLYRIPALNFPEVPEDHEYIALNGGHAVVANPKT